MFKLTRLLNYAALFLFIGLGLLAARQVLAQQEQDDATPVTAAEAADTFEPFPPITAGSIVPNPVYYTVTDKENQEITAADASAPVMTLFYGNDQKFGQLGTPQRWVNILGNVSGGRLVSAMNYTLNGGQPITLSWGSDHRRLADAGDFNVEIDTTNLLENANQVVVSAFYTDGKSVTQNVTVQNKLNTVWPLPYTADWATITNIQDLAQVVDGKWKIEAGAVRTDQFDYDRLVAIGDKQWTDYEVVVPITIHSTDPLTGAGFKYPSNGPGVGVLLRWQGHVNQTKEQPSVGYQQFGGLGWYRFNKDKDTNNLVTALQFLGPGGRELQTLTDKQLQFNVPYIFKMSVQSDPTQPATYRLKVWPASEVEPFAWDIAKQGKTGEPISGSLLLVAHHVDASFGKVTVTPLTALRPKLTIIANNGVVNILTPQGQTDYAYGTNVKLRAIGNPGFELGSWGGDASGNINPLTLNLTKDTTVVANFVQGAPPTIALSSSGSGTTGGAANVSPAKPSYNLNEIVTLTAVPKVGSQFIRWLGDTGGLANPKVITVTKSLSITALFGPAVPPVSDDFNDCQLNTSVWNFQDPVGNSSYQVNGQQLLINAPAGSDHNLWLNANQAPRLMQAVAAGTTDFSIETKFESNVTQKFQLQGVIVQQDANNYMRFDYFNDGSGIKALGALFLNGTPVISETRKVTVPVGANLFIRIQRKGDGFTYARSFDGANWSKVTTITQTLSINSVGVFAGNVAANRQTPAPAHTAIVDYFFNSAAKILLEDSRGHHLDVAKIGNGTVSVSPIKADYTCTEPLQVTAISDSGWLFTGWTPAALGTSNSASLTLSQIPQVTANFTLNNNPNQFNLATPVVGSGTVDKSPQKQAYDPNEQVTLTARPAPGYKFVGWDGDATGTQNPLIVGMTANKTVTANFEFDPNAVQLLYLPLISN